MVSINDAFRITVTNASAMRIDSSQAQLTRSTYSNEVLRIVSALETSVFSPITQFATVQAVGENQEPLLTVYSSSDNITLYGACQVHVNEKEGLSFYIQDYIPAVGINVADIINRQIFMQAFQIEVIDGTATVKDTEETTVIIITSSNERFSLPLAREVTYSLLFQMLEFINMDNTSTTFSNISSFSIFFRNMLEVFDSSENGSDITISLSNGGILYIDRSKGNALFTSNSNPTVSFQIDGAALSVSASYHYIIDTDILGVYSLVVMRENSTFSDIREQIVVLTGALVVEVEAFHAVSYNNDEVVIIGSDGEALIHLAPVTRFVVNTGVVPYISYSGLSSVLFSGPGTLVVSRSRGFFTTETSLGRSLSFAVTTASVPVVQFERVHIRFNMIGGIAYSIGAVVLRIGGYIVSVYEAMCHKTHESEVVVYANGRVTIHQSTIVDNGDLFYTGQQQILTYITSEGSVEELRNVEKLYIFNGGEVKMFSVPENVSVSASGRLFVSVNGTEVLFMASDIITSSVADLIRRLVTPEHTLESSQFGSIVRGVFQLSTNSAFILYIGGGTIWHRVYNEITYIFYVNDMSFQNEIIQAVNTFLGVTKFVPQTDFGELRIVFNGQVIYSLSVTGSVDIRLSSTDSFRYTDAALYGDFFSRRLYSGISELVIFDGMKVQVVDVNSGPAEFVGPGLLLVQLESGTAFFTTWPATVSYILQSIATVQQHLVPPTIHRSGTQSLKVSGQSAVVMFGTNVKAFEGADISFVCKIVSSIPRPQITIFKVDSSGLIPLMESNSTLQSRLTLSGIGMNDSGNYLCRADNGVPPTDEVMSKLNVREAGNRVCAIQLQCGTGYNRFSMLTICAFRMKSSDF